MACYRENKKIGVGWTVMYTEYTFTRIKNTVCFTGAVTSVIAL